MGEHRDRFAVIAVETRGEPHGAHGSGVGDVAGAWFQLDEHRESVAQGEERRPDPAVRPLPLAKGWTRTRRGR